MLLVTLVATFIHSPGIHFESEPHIFHSHTTAMYVLTNTDFVVSSRFFSLDIPLLLCYALLSLCIYLYSFYNDRSSSHYRNRRRTGECRRAGTATGEEEEDTEGDKEGGVAGAATLPPTSNLKRSFGSITRRSRQGHWRPWFRGRGRYRGWRGTTMGVRQWRGCEAEVGVEVGVGAAEEEKGAEGEGGAERKKVG